MKRWAQWGALGLGGVVLLAGAIGAYLVATFDADRYKGVLIEWVREHRQRELRIEGPLELKLWPRLQVRLQDVSLSEHRRPQETFLALRDARLAVDVWPLLRKSLVIDRIEAHGLTLRYLRDAQGRRNIDDLLGRDDGPEDSAGKSVPVHFDVAALDISDATVTVHDELGGLRGDVVVRRLQSGRLADQLSAPVEVDATLKLLQPGVQGRLSGKTRLRFERAASRLTLSDMHLAYQGEALGVRGLDASMQGSLVYEAASRALQAENLVLRTRAEVGSLRVEPSELKARRFAYDPARRALRLEELDVQLDAVRDKHPLKAQLRWPALEVAGERLTGSAMQGQVELKGEQPLRITFSSAAPVGNFDLLRLPGFQARLEGTGPRKLTGELRADLALQPEKAAVALDALAGRLRLEDPKLKALDARLGGRATASPQAAQWQLEGALNDNEFDTRGRALFTGTVPTVHMQGRFARLDLDRLLPERSERPASAAASPAPTPPDTPVDLSVLREWQGSLALTAGELSWKPYRLRDLRLDASLEGGMLRVPRYAAGLWGGRVEGSAFADARAQRVVLKAQAQQIDVEAALRDVARKDLLRGTGRLQLDVESAGRSLQEMKSRLAGKAAVQVRDGAIKGVNLARTLREAKAALSLRQDALQRARQTEETDFSELSATFDIAQGVARNDDLDAKSPFLRLGGAGAIDIGRNRIDYTLRATVADTSKGQGGGDLARLRGLTVPVRLSGPLEAVDWQIQWSASAAAAAEAAVKSRIEDKLRKELGLPSPSEGAASEPVRPRDRLKDALKGLIR